MKNSDGWMFRVVSIWSPFSIVSYIPLKSLLRYFFICHMVSALFHSIELPVVRLMSVLPSNRSSDTLLPLLRFSS